jgi:hypothetical protein
LAPHLSLQVGPFFMSWEKPTFMTIIHVFSLFVIHVSNWFCGSTLSNVVICSPYFAFMLLLLSCASNLVVLNAFQWTHLNMPSYFLCSLSLMDILCHNSWQVNL